jgi:peptidoglycan/xylan/chitin deacetylase (PgdA/CDA1 family)
MTWTRAPRGWVRDILGGLLHLVGATSFTRRHKNQLAIVTFHRVLPAAQLADYPIKSIVVTPQELRWFLDILRQHFSCGPLTETASAWLAGDHSKPCLAITFDDGQLDNYLHASPVLRSLGLSATFFVTLHGVETGQLLWHDRMAYALVRLFAEGNGIADELLAPFTNLHRQDPNNKATLHKFASDAVRRAKYWTAAKRKEWLDQAEQRLGSVAPQWDGMMTANELKSMVDAGHEIGCHSRTHEILSTLDEVELRREIAEPKSPIEHITGKPCLSFCYPNGDYDSRCTNLVSKHYRFGVSTQWGTNAPASDPFTLRRFDMVAEHVRSYSGNLSVSRLAWRMSGLYPGLGR